MVGDTLYAVLLIVPTAGMISKSITLGRLRCGYDRIPSQAIAFAGVLTDGACAGDCRWCDLATMSDEILDEPYESMGFTVVVGVFVTLGTVIVVVAIIVLVTHEVVDTLATGVEVMVIQAVGVICTMLERCIHLWDF